MGTCGHVSGVAYFYHSRPEINNNNYITDGVKVAVAPVSADFLILNWTSEESEEFSSSQKLEEKFKVLFSWLLSQRNPAFNWEPAGILLPLILQKNCETETAWHYILWF